VSTATGAPLECGGLAVARIAEALRARDPDSAAFHLYDLDAVAARARRVRAAFAPLAPLVAYAMKANGLPALVARLGAEGLGADAGSRGELALASRAGVPASRIVLNGNGRTEGEAAWAAERGIHSVNADHVAELDLLDAAAARAGRPLRVALRVNPGIETPGHRYVATGHDDAKFGVSPHEALEAWAARARWPHLRLDGVHVHVGSQVLDASVLEAGAVAALELTAESARRGAPLGLVNLGGGFGFDYEGRRELPLDVYAKTLIDRMANTEVARGVEWVLEPGRWLVAPAGLLVARVLWVKRRDGRRFVVLGAGMNDFIRPALYQARHRIVPVTPRAGDAEPALVVGPVCESGDVFATGVTLPPLERGDWVALLDTGAYGAAMASNYNGRGRLAELVLEGGAVTVARAAETPEDVAARAASEPLPLR
jgi:diaminopimelate decarboxylase